ncbi:MAG: manganese efflux pump [Deltaproteobacteria bacterium]|nr:manganese efflux pump [Deltaproteobacteria bacterium]
MSFNAVLLIAVALAVDAFAVALVAGITLPRVTMRHTLRLACYFGIFQAGMNFIGWGLGLSVRSLIGRFDHWIAFALLAIIGGKMIIEALQDKESRAEPGDPTRGRTVVILAVATSIDALAVGLSFAILKVDIWFSALVIGIVAATFTAIGINLGHFVGNSSRLGSRIEIIGGLVLIIIGLNILRQHGVF